MENMSLFFDSESLAVSNRKKEEEQSRLLETARAMNREQLRGLDVPARYTQTGKPVSYPSVREYIINQDLETATVRHLETHAFTHVHIRV